MNELKMFRLPNIDAMYRDMAHACGNQVSCRKCGRTELVYAAQCLRHGWPKCCGETMGLDQPGAEKV